MLHPRRITAIIAFCAFALAATAFLFHDLAVNRQVDTQMLSYAFQMMDAMRSGHSGDALLAVHKYPLIGPLILIIVNGVTLGVMLIFGAIPSVAGMREYVLGEPAAVYFVSRAVILVSAIGTMILLTDISRRVFKGRDVHHLGASMILCGSLLFILFSTAIRPHMLVTFFTVLTFWASLRLVERKSQANQILAFGSALLAFCTLQSGLIAFIFPLWAVATEKEKFEWRRLLTLRTLITLIVFAVLSTIIGYTYLWNIPLGNPVSIGYDLGNDYIVSQPSWTGMGFWVLIKTMMGSELILFVCAAAGVLFLLCAKNPHPGPLPAGRGSLFVVCLYLAIYVLIFGVYAGTSPRFFLPILPFLALLGAPVISKYLPAWIAVAVLTVAVNARMAYLAFIPDSYRITQEFLIEKAKGASIASNIPAYMLGIPPTRASIKDPNGAREEYIASLDHDLPDARSYIPMLQKEKADVIVWRKGPMEDLPELPDRKSCFDVRPSDTDDEVFHWAESDWQILFLLNAERMGPTIRVFCRVN